MLYINGAAFCVEIESRVRGRGSSRIRSRSSLSGLTGYVLLRHGFVPISALIEL